MFPKHAVLILVVVFGICGVTFGDAKQKLSTMENWAQWRGPLGNGFAPNATPPVEWSETRNIRWKSPLPGKGHSTPIVWNNRIFVTAAIPYGKRLVPKPDTAPGAHDNSPVTQRHEFVVIAMDRRNGKVEWQKTLQKSLPIEGGHYTGSLASNSPATDGERLFAFFGSHGLYCLDFDGNVIWEKDLGQMQTKHAHGEGASPVLFGQTLVVNWDHRGQSFVLALDTQSGKVKWKKKRDEVTSWSTPIVVEHDGRPQVIVSGTNRIRGYDLEKGGVIWQCGGLSNNVVASPVAGNGFVYAGSSYETRAMLAIKLDGAKGNITDSKNVVWSRKRQTPYVPSPLLYENSLYFLGHYQGILTKLDARTGEEPTGPFRLDGIRDVYSSIVGADGHVYITDRDGTTMVIAHGELPRVLASNQLDESISASAALVGKEIFLRGDKHLYSIAE